MRHGLVGVAVLREILELAYPLQPGILEHGLEVFRQPDLEGAPVEVLQKASGWGELQLQAALDAVGEHQSEAVHGFLSSST